LHYAGFRPFRNKLGRRIRQDNAVRPRPDNVIVGRGRFGQIGAVADHGRFDGFGEVVPQVWRHQHNAHPQLTPDANQVAVEITAAIVDRLTFNGYLIETGADSYRLKSALEQQH
jgi:hypothetical protein